jgi:hypothetical protein
VEWLSLPRTRAPQNGKASTMPGHCVGVHVPMV